MLCIFGNRRSRDCDGTSRRDFLKVGTLGLETLGLGTLGFGGSDNSVAAVLFQNLWQHLTVP